MKYLKIFKNWRIIALTVMAVAAFILILGESEKATVIAITKLIGFTLAFFCYKIAKDWHEKGLINEINEFNDNNEE